MNFITVAFVVFTVTMAACLFTRERLGERPHDMRVGCLDVKYPSSAAVINAPECPGDGLFILPRTYPMRTLFLGYTSHPLHVQFIHDVLQRMDDPHVSVSLLLARHEIQEAYDDLLSIKRLGGGRLQFIPTPSDESLWAQDYFEVAVSGLDGKPLLIDLPYTAREGELIPAALGLTCDMDVVRQPEFFDDLIEVGSGEYGGNIEAFPGDIVVVGDNMSVELREHLAEVLDQKLIVVNVSWLETGHVDELFSLLPVIKPDSNSSCDFAISYASPLTAFDLLRRHGYEHGKDSFSPQVHDDLDVNAVALDERIQYCLESVARQSVDRHPLADFCNELVMANNAYAEIILGELEKLVTLVRERSGCRHFELIDVPVLFAPSSIQEEYGTPHDVANAVNANAINNILINDLLVIPFQSYPPLRDYINRRYAALGLKLQEVQADLAHQLSGGLHCLSNSVRVCRPKG